MRKFRYSMDNDILFIDRDKRYQWGVKSGWVETKGNPILNQWATDILDGKREGFKEINTRHYYDRFA